MNEYEISYITNPTLTEEARGAADKSVDTAVEKANGSIINNTENERRKLAYPVNDQSVGFLRTVQANIDPDKVKAVRQALQKSSGIIRLSIIQTTQREAVQATIFEAAAKEAQVETKPEAKTPAKPAKELTEDELEEKIAKALDEEVK